MNHNRVLHRKRGGAPLLRNAARMALVLLALLLLPAVASAQSGGPYDLTWSTADGGGGTSSGGTFQVDGTAGQPDAGVLSGGVFSVEGGFWNQDAGPTAVVVSSFRATSVNGGVLLTWETLSEIETAGFNLYRSMTPEALGMRLNETLIPAQAPGQGMGARYAFLDGTVAAGVIYYYTLEDVDVMAEGTLHGPVVLAPWWNHLPLVMRDG